MLDLTNIHSLTDFQRNARKYVARLRRSGRPAVLTVNGEARLVVQDATSYQRLLDALERADAIAGIRQGLEGIDAGAGRSAKAVDADLRRKHRIPRDA